MATTHKTETLFPGDTWEIYGKLHNADGTPMQLLAGTKLSWKLEPGAGGVVAASATEADGIVVTNAAAGEIKITLPPTKTTGITPGLYTDQLQVQAGGIVSTQWVGAIEVKKGFFVP